jgi:hypothetical protein
MTFCAGPGGMPLEHRDLALGIVGLLGQRPGDLLDCLLVLRGQGGAQCTGLAHFGDALIFRGEVAEAGHHWNQPKP